MRCPHCNHDFAPQLSLASPSPETKTRRTDPSTSHNAAKLAYPRGEGQRRRILLAIADSDHGLTADEASTLLHLPYTSVSTRISELTSGGWLRRSGQRPTSTGVLADTLALTDAAWQELGEVEA